MMRDKHLIYHATVKHFEAERDKALVNARVYLDNPTGIGEHQDIMDALDKELTELSKHHDNAEMLLRYFGKRKEEVTETPKEKDKK